MPGCRPGSSSGIFGQWFVEEVEGFERLFCRSTAKPSMTPEPKAATKDVKIDLFEDDDDFDEFEINEGNSLLLRMQITLPLFKFFFVYFFHSFRHVFIFRIDICLFFPISWPLRNQTFNRTSKYNSISFEHFFKSKI